MRVGREARTSGELDRNQTTSSWVPPPLEWKSKKKKEKIQDDPKPRSKHYFERVP